MPERTPAPLDDDLEKEIADALGDESLLGVSADRTAPPPREHAPVLEEPEAGAFADAAVSGMDDTDVFLEFGPRAQGVVPRDQFGHEPAVGERVRVFVQGFDAKESLWLCNLKRALTSAAGWETLEVGVVALATARAVNKGGVEVQVGHVSGFLPASHVALERVEDLETVLGQTWPVEVLEVDPDRRRLVVSRRAVLAREREERRQETLESAQPGDVIEGTVTRLERFGAFVDLGGGVEGLLHVSQMAWKRVQRPEDVVAAGDRVRVQILEVDREEGRIGLGMKQLQEDPWLRFVREHPPGTVTEGTVTRVAHYGAFVELAEGVEGLAHVSELAPHPIGSPKEVVRPGQRLGVRIVGTEAERRRIALSLLTERGDRLTDDVADDDTIRDVLEGRREEAPEPTLGDILRKALGGEPEP